MSNIFTDDGEPFAGPFVDTAPRQCSCLNDGNDSFLRTTVATYNVPIWRGRAFSSEGIYGRREMHMTSIDRSETSRVTVAMYDVAIWRERDFPSKGDLGCRRRRVTLRSDTKPHPRRRNEEPKTSGGDWRRGKLRRLSPTARRLGDSCLRGKA